MNKNILLIVLGSIILLGCYDPDEVSYGDGGIYLGIINRTDKTYIGKQSLYIGAIKDNKFYITDSISSYDTILPQVLEDNEYSATTTYINGIQDWRPQTTDVADISNKGAFLFIMSNGEQVLTSSFEFPKPALDGASIYVRIDSTGISNTNDINQNLEVVK